MSETLYQGKVEQLRRDIGQLERKRADAAKNEARHRDGARRALASITRSTGASTAASKQRSAESEERWADRERDKGVSLLSELAK
jgi:hypothetical protein